MTRISHLRFGLLTYGPNVRSHREATLAVLTIQLHAPPGSEIVLITDHPDMYRWLGDSITIDPLSHAALRAWRGPFDDTFRPKLEAARRLAAGRRIDVVLVDTDTMARRDLTSLADRLDAGAVFMHRREYLLASPPRKNDRHLAREILGRSWQGITPDPATASMWNSGVLASSHAHAGIFDVALAVFDEIRPASRYFAVDQLACSIAFPTYGPLEEAAPWFDHYWANRPWFDCAAERFFSRGLLEGLSPSDALDRLRRHPIIGAVDGRAPWWSTRLRRLITAPGPDDDKVGETSDSPRED